MYIYICDTIVITNDHIYDKLPKTKNELRIILHSISTVNVIT